MVNQIKVTGMILSSTPVGEYDRRVVLLTKERGKISGFARGARRQGSSLLGATGAFTFGKFTVYEGKSSYTLVQAEVINYFSELRGDTRWVCRGLYFLEMADYYAREGTDETLLLKLLYQSLRALTAKSIPDSLVQVIFEWKAIAINGEGPQAFSCVFCGKKEGLERFSMRRGGLVCGKCQEEGRKLHPSTVYTLQYILSAPVEQLYQFVVSRQVQEELETLWKDYSRIHIDKTFQTLEILKQIAGE
ncbi:DNA repair protein RecO [Suipraeoptans intestinalis]|uniref:DNA repair protein RecO n=1 Tax=Suipraeoptans intestinalis TaxID=2606628 RepID=UPI0023EF68C3|nr:DNA repair protein RecO [Suipraeoptans intestinalis]MDD7769613.1 DNA repair protein RecO [Suipraeoptans intestinalis]